MGNLSERKDDRIVRDDVNFGTKKAVAGSNLDTDRLVGRWQTLDGVGDATATQYQVVVCTLGIGPTGQSQLMQGLVQEDACVVTGKWSPGSIRAVEARRQANDQ